MWAYIADIVSALRARRQGSHTVTTVAWVARRIGGLFWMAGVVRRLLQGCVTPAVEADGWHAFGDRCSSKVILVINGMTVSFHHLQSLLRSWCSNPVCVALALPLGHFVAIGEHHGTDGCSRIGWFRIGWKLKRRHLRTPLPLWRHVPHPI